MYWYESLFYMAASLTLLWVSFYLLKRVSELQIKNAVNAALIDHAKNNVIDMGFQLYNLTGVQNQLAPGYVYVVKSDSGHYKIGRTANYQDRAKTFHVKLPVEVEFIVLIKTGNMNQLENIFHRQYKHKRVGGEWFKLDTHDLLFLGSYPGNMMSGEFQL